MRTRTNMRRHAVATAVATALLFGASAVRADDEDRRVRIFNDTNIAITEFFASNIDRMSWEENILGGETIEPGTSVLVIVDDGSGHCLFKFKGVDAQGRTGIVEQFNVCDEGSFHFTEYE